jgi:hypothetical protein
MSRKETKLHPYLPIINGEEIIRKHIRQMGQWGCVTGRSRRETIRTSKSVGLGLADDVSLHFLFSVTRFRIRIELFLSHPVS